MFHSGQWGTFKASSFYKNPKVDELLDAALRSTDRKVRTQAYAGGGTHRVDDAAGVWIYNTKYFGRGRRPRGIRFSPIGNGQRFAGFTISNRRGDSPLIPRRGGLDGPYETSPGSIAPAKPALEVCLKLVGR